jgi:hypothetical protein
MGSFILDQLGLLKEKKRRTFSILSTARGKEPVLRVPDDDNIGNTLKTLAEYYRLHETHDGVLSSLIYQSGINVYPSWKVDQVLKYKGLEQLRRDVLSFSDVGLRAFEWRPPGEFTREILEPRMEYIRENLEGILQGKARVPYGLGPDDFRLATEVKRHLEHSQFYCYFVVTDDVRLIHDLQGFINLMKAPSRVLQISVLSYMFMMGEKDLDPNGVRYFDLTSGEVKTTSRSVTALMEVYRKDASDIAGCDLPVVVMIDAPNVQRRSRMFSISRKGNGSATFVVRKLRSFPPDTPLWAWRDTLDLKQRVGLFHMGKRRDLYFKIGSFKRGVNSALSASSLASLLSAASYSSGGW